MLSKKKKLWAGYYSNKGGQSIVNAELQVWLDEINSLGYSRPADGIISALDTYITAEKSSGGWYADDAHYIFKFNNLALSNISLLNLKDATKHRITTSGSPVYSINGWKGDPGSQSYLDTNYNPATDGVNYQQNSAHRSAWVDLAPTNGVVIDGTISSSATRMVSEDSLAQRINRAAAINATADLSGTGYRAIDRPNFNETDLFVDDVKLDRTGSSQAIVSENILLFRSQSLYSNVQLSAYTIGGHLTDEQHFARAVNLAALFAALESISPTFDIDHDFDALNLQSNDINNFVLAGNSISQWKDISPAARHATFETGNPQLVGGIPYFDGVDDALELATEFASDEFSMYVVVKADSPPQTLQAIVGGASTDNYVGLIQSGHRLLRVSNESSSGETTNYRSWGEEWYQIFSVRKIGSTLITKCNTRELFQPDSDPVPTGIHTFGYIGRSVNGNHFQGTIRAVCITSQFVQNDTDDIIFSHLFSRYNLPEVSNAIVGFGDSITGGAGSTNANTHGWLALLATELGRPWKNFGVSGSKLTGGLQNDSAIDRYNTQVIEPPYSDTICMMFGTNDSSTGPVYQAALETILQGFLDAGYDPAKIIVGTVPYRFDDEQADKAAEYNAIITSVCAAKGLPEPADVYNSMKNGGGNALLADGVHPNDAGHIVIYEAFLARLQ